MGYSKVANVRNKELSKQQLGMDLSTAQNRLRKQVMFKYIKLAGHENCYRCNLPIDRAEDLSIDHKENWLHVNSDLFWDLENIAFSHIRCNNKYQRQTGIPTIEALRNKNLFTK